MGSKGPCLWAYVLICCLATKSCPTLLLPQKLEPAGLLHPWNFPGTNTGISCHFLLQGNLPDLGTEPVSPAFPALASGFFTTVPPAKPYVPVGQTIFFFFKVGTFMVVQWLRLWVPNAGGLGSLRELDPTCQN